MLKKKELIVIYPKFIPPLEQREFYMHNQPMAEANVI